jgi:hypothetical protein
MASANQWGTKRHKQYSLQKHDCNTTANIAWNRIAIEYIDRIKQETLSAKDMLSFILYMGESKLCRFTRLPWVYTLYARNSHTSCKTHAIRLWSVSFVLYMG